MSSTDSLPVISQAKRVAKVIAGNVADSIPVVGHVKGLIHYVYNDMEGCNKAIKSASRSVGVAVGGVVAGGPISPFAGGVAGGIAADLVISFADTTFHRELRLYGNFQSLRRLFYRKMDAGEGFYWILTLFFDGLAGMTYADIYDYWKHSGIDSSRAQYQQYKSEIENSKKITLKGGQTASQLAEQLQKARNELKNVVKDDDILKLGKNIVDTIKTDVEIKNNAEYLFNLREELKIVKLRDPLKTMFRFKKIYKVGEFEAEKLHEAAENSIYYVYKLSNYLCTPWKKTILYAVEHKCKPCEKTVKIILMQDAVINTAFLTVVNLITHCVTIKETKEERDSKSVIDDSKIVGSNSEFTDG